MTGTKDTALGTALSDELGTIDGQAHLAHLQSMQQAKSFTARKPEERPGALEAIYRLSDLTSFGRSVAGTGATLTRLAQLKGRFEHAITTARSLSNGFVYSGLALAFLDFIRIPVIYLTAWGLGAKIPVSATKNVRWFYASLSFGLSLTALTIPAMAPPIAIFSASLGLLVSIISLVKFFYRRHQIAKELESIAAIFPDEENRLLQLKSEAAKKIDALQKAIPRDDDVQIDVNELKGRYDAQIEKIQRLHDRKYELEQKQLKRGIGIFLDKSVGVGLSSLALIGIAISLSFPATGMAILAASASLGTLYIIGRITYPLFECLFISLGREVKSTIQSDVETSRAEEKLVRSNVDVKDPADRSSYKPLFSTGTVTQANQGGEFTPVP